MFLLGLLFLLLYYLVFYANNIGTSEVKMIFLKVSFWKQYPFHHLNGILWKENTWVVLRLT